ncbi:B3 domain-containing protein [Nymphaea thermarum]|nr:B3 domain-containing protein [Nymphaea thermarum]
MARSQNIGVQCCFPEAVEEKQCDGCSWKKPQFFKVLFELEDFCKSLQIPPAFLKHLRIGESGAAIVKDPAGRSWDIKLLRMGDHIIFEEGWMKFVEQNGLDTSDFLVFRYDGELHFTVTIFNKGCVEKSPATPTADVIADEDHLQSLDMDMEEKCTTTSTADVVVDEDHLESVDLDMEENCTRTKAWDAASSLRTTNPTFKKMVAESDSYRMRIPADASNESVPKKTCQVKLEDPDGRQWPVKFLIWISSNKAHSLPRMERKLSFSSGWHNFFEANCLKKGDGESGAYLAGASPAPNQGLRPRRLGIHYSAHLPRPAWSSAAMCTSGWSFVNKGGKQITARAVSLLSTKEGNKSLLGQLEQ